MTNRRRFIRIFSIAFLAAPVVLLGQNASRVHRIGVLAADANSNAKYLSLSLRNRGWIEGTNLTIEKRSAGGNVELLQALASDLVQLNVDVIVSFGAAASLAAKNATSRIPIVSTSGDPIRLRLVTEPSRPAGNITGVSTMALQHATKRLELLRELLPNAMRIGEIDDPADLFRRLVREDYERAFRTLAMRPIFVDVTSPGDNAAPACGSPTRSHVSCFLCPS